MDKVAGIPFYVIDVKAWTLNLQPVDEDFEPLVGISCESCLWVEWWNGEELPTLEDLLKLAEGHKHKEGARG